MKTIKSDTLLKRRRKGKLSIAYGSAQPGTIVEVEYHPKGNRKFLRITR